MIDYEGYSNYMNWLIDTRQMILPEKKAASCHFCGRTDLSWSSSNGVSRLVDSKGNYHTCYANNQRKYR